MILAELPASLRDVVRRSARRAVRELGFDAERPDLVELAFERLEEELAEPGLSPDLIPAVGEAVREVARALR